MSESSNKVITSRTDDFGDGDGDFLKCDQKMDLNNAYRVVEELEDWKECQQRRFRSILASKERKHIAFLSEEWDKRRFALQEQLEQSIDKCDSLASQLQLAHQEALASELASRQTERKLMSELDEAERLYEAKLLSLKEASRRVEGDLNHKMKLMEIDKSLLEERLAVLKRENTEFTETHERLKKEIAQVRKNSLKKDQIRSLIKQLRSCEDKLNQVVQSKEYFKEEWAKAARMVHHYKGEHQQNISNRIKMHKKQIDDSTGGDLSGVLNQLKQRIMNVDLEDDIADPLLTQRSQPNLGGSNIGGRPSYSNFSLHSARFSSDGRDNYSSNTHNINYLSASRSNSRSSTSISSSSSHPHNFCMFDSLPFPDLSLSSGVRHNHTLSDNSMLSGSQKFQYRCHYSENDLSH